MTRYLLKFYFFMKNLIEIRIHGRGGQGAKTASELLVETALGKGKYIQSFPEYGPERAGAPMRAYARISDQPIHIHSGITNPNIVAVIDPTLLDSIDVTEGLSEDGILLVNTALSPKEIRKKLNFNKGKACTVDATKIALETIGLPLPNTSILGALIKITGLIKLEDLEGKIKEKFLKKIGEKKTQGNIDSVKRAYNEVQED